MPERRDIAPHQDYAPIMPYASNMALGQALPPSISQTAPADEPQIFQAMFRHWWLILLFAMVGTAAALLYLRHAEKLYTSYAKLYIKAAGGPTAEALGTVQRANFLNTQCEVMRSSPILAKATEPLQHLKTFDGWKPVDFLQMYLEAEVGRKDDIITVSIYSPYPEEAAQIVNAVINTYTLVSTQEKESSSTKLLRTLESKKAENDVEVRGIEQKMYEFKKMNPQLALDTVISSELALKSQAYINAQLESINDKSTYAPGHPKVRASKAKEENMFNLYEQALKKHVEVNAKAADYQRFQVDLAQKQEFSRRLLDRIKQLEIASSQMATIADVEIIEPPRAESSPAWPRKYRTLAIALAAGTLLGAGLALLRDRLDGRLRSVEDIQSMIGLPVLGVVPAMSGRRTAVARAMTVHLDPRSVVAESYRSIRTAVYFGAGANRCKTILVTSPEPGDGKTTCASNLAIAIAQTGRSVLLLDADFRKPTQHKNLDIKDSVGLSSVLAGREPLSKAIQHTGVEGLHILPCGPIPANPSEILNSREFGELVDKLATKYDHILFDSPPVNAVTDARILGAVCDATIMVLRADKSTRKAGEHARNGLMAVGAKVLGVIVNDAPKRSAYEVYGGTYYGSSEIAVRPGLYEERISRRRLPHLADDEEDGGPRQRRDIA